MSSAQILLEQFNLYRKGGKIELDEKQTNSVLDTTQTSKSNPPPKMIKTSVNPDLSHGEFTGESM